MKALVITPLLALALSGCAATIKDLTAARTFINDPATQQALASVRAGVTVLLCDVQAGSQLVGALQAATRKSQAIPAGTNKWIVSSTILCNFAQGGTIAGTAIGTGAASTAIIK